MQRRDPGDSPAILPESPEILVLAIEALHKEVKSVELQVSWAKTKAKVSGSLLDETVLSVHESFKATEILESLTFIGSIVHSSSGSCQDFFKKDWSGMQCLGIS